MNGTGFAEPFGDVVVDFLVKRIQKFLRQSPQKLAQEIVRSGVMKSRIAPLFLILNLITKNYDSIIRPRVIRNKANEILKPSSVETDMKIKADTSFDHKIDFNYTDITRPLAGLVASYKLQRSTGKKSLLEAERKLGIRKLGRIRDAEAGRNLDKGGVRVHYKFTWQAMLEQQILSDPDVIKQLHNTLKENGLLFRYFTLIFEAMFIVVTKLGFENIESLYKRTNKKQISIQWESLREYFNSLDETSMKLLQSKVVNLLVENPASLKWVDLAFTP